MVVIWLSLFNGRRTRTMHRSPGGGYPLQSNLGRVQIQSPLHICHNNLHCYSFCDQASWMDRALYTPFTLDSILSTSVLTDCCSRRAPLFALYSVALSTMATRSSAPWRQQTPSHPPPLLSPPPHSPHLPTPECSCRRALLLLQLDSGSHACRLVPSQ